MTTTNHPSASKKEEVRISVHAQKLFGKSPFKTLLYSSQLEAREKNSSGVAERIKTELQRPEYIIQAGLLLDTFLDTNLLSMLGVVTDTRTVFSALPANESEYGGSLYGKRERLIRYMQENISGFLNPEQRRIIQEIFGPELKEMDIPKDDALITAEQAEMIIQQITRLNLRLNAHLNIFAMALIPEGGLRDMLALSMNVFTQNYADVELAKLIADERVTCIWLFNKIQNNSRLSDEQRNGLLERLEDYSVLYFTPAGQVSEKFWQDSEFIARRARQLSFIIEDSML